MLALGAVLCGVPVAQAQVASTATARLAALLESTGGRQAWAAARGYRVDALHYLAAEPAPFKNTIWLDFSRPRVRIESNPAAGQRIRILDDDRGWRLTRDENRPLTAEEVADDRAFWNTNVYRTLHRLALAQSDLTASITEDDRLMIAERGAPLLWYRQNSAGEPIAFGVGTSGEGTIFGPLVRYGDLRFPSFSVRNGGRWRAIITRFVVDPDLSDGVLRRGVPGR
jgi:hypothetical protein